MHGEAVLVMPSQSDDNPAVGMRGSIRVDSQGHVDVDLQFADMYDRPAAMQRIRLNSRQVARLWASKASYGAYALRLDGPILAPQTGERVVGRFGRTREQATESHNVRPSEREA